MPEIEDLRRQVSRRFVPEMKAALAAAEHAQLPVRAYPPNWESAKDIQYLYRSGSLLTRDADAPRVARALHDVHRRSPLAKKTSPMEEPRGHSPMKGVTRLVTPVSDAWHTYD